MSLIASFWTLGVEHKTRLVDAFRPQIFKETQRRWLLFTETQERKVYPWFDYLKVHAKQEAIFPYSGTCMADLELMLPDGSSLFSLCLPESNDLSSYAGGSIALIDEPIARVVETRLAACALTEDDVVAFYASDERPLADRTDALPILEAHKQLITWCNTVLPGRIGLLNIG